MIHRENGEIRERISYGE
nr:hypothetical protein [Pareuzebyella sediminis]